MKPSNADFLIQHYVDNNIVKVDLNTGIVYQTKNDKHCHVSFSKGYCRTRFTHPITHKQHYARIHRIVGYVIFGSAIFSDNLVIDHIDFNRFNNHPSNLALITNTENLKKKHYSNWFTVFDNEGNAIAKCKNENDAITISKIHAGEYLKAS